MSSSKRIVKNTLLLYVRQIVVLIIGLFTTRFTLQILGVTDYGIYAVVAGFTSLLSVLTSTLTSGVQRFITYELGSGTVESQRNVYVASVNIQLIISCGLLLVGETIGAWFVLTQLTLPYERVTVAYCVFQIALLSSCITLLNIPNDAEIIAHEDMGVLAVVSVLESVLRLIAVILLLFVSWDLLITYAVALFVILIIKRAISIWYCYHHYQEARYRFEWNYPVMKSMMKLSGWMGFFGLATTGFTQGVVILLNVFFGPVINAAYNVAVQAYSGIRAFCSNFQLASNPQIIKSYAMGDLKHMEKLVFSVCKMSFFLIFILSFPFLVNAEYVFSVWLKEVPPHATSFFVVLLIYAYIDVFAYPLNVAANATGKIKKYSIINAIGVLLPIPIAYIVYALGAFAESIFLIAIIVSFIFVGIRITLLCELIQFNQRVFYKKMLLRIILSASLSMLVPVVIAHFCLTHSFAIVGLNFALSYIISIPVIYLVGLENDERQLLKSIVRSFARHG